MLRKKSCMPKETVAKNKSGSLTHPEETLDNKTLQATSYSGHNSREQAKAQTELACAVSHTERILSMCEIGYEIHISLNFSFKFGGIIFILLNIKHV